MNIKTKTVETVSIRVNVTRRDIEDGKCLIPGKCMEKVAIERALRDLDPKGGDHRVRVDGGVIRFNLKGRHCEAVTPKIAKRALIQFDRESGLRKRIEDKGEVFKSKVEPHTYKIEATVGAKIIPMTADRMKQIYEARDRRIKAGKPDKRKYTLRHRVEGLGNV